MFLAINVSLALTLPDADILPMKRWVGTDGESVPKRELPCINKSLLELIYPLTLTSLEVKRLVNSMLVNELVPALELIGPEEVILPVKVCLDVASLPKNEL